MERSKIKTIAEKHLRNLTFESGESSWNYFKESGTLNGSALYAVELLVKECASQEATTSTSALPISDVSTRTFTEDDVYNNIAEFVRLYATYDYPEMTKEETLKDIKELWSELI